MKNQNFLGEYFFKFLVQSTEVVPPVFITKKINNNVGYRIAKHSTKIDPKYIGIDRADICILYLKVRSII